MDAAGERKTTKFRSEKSHFDLFIMGDHVLFNTIDVKTFSIEKKRKERDDKRQQ